MVNIFLCLYLLIIGKWKPYGINPIFRFCRYNAPSNGFILHRDANHVASYHRRSIFTIMIYLNEQFVGGTTNFYATYGKRLGGCTVQQEIDSGMKTVLTCSVKPQSGTAILFEHDLLHEGNEVTATNTYVQT
jgi:hypothetical protein